MAQSTPQKALKSEVSLVALHVTVADNHGEFIPGLKNFNFRVYENKIEQKIAVFSRDDIPVTMGIIVDNSASMRTKRAQVNAAAMTFVRTSNPQDEAFVVNFDDEYYIDTDGDFTSDQKNLDDALAHIDSHGSTALYDALIGSLDHLKKGHKDKRVLLLVTDGVDNASRESFETTIKIAEQSNAAIYAIGVFSDEDRRTEKGDIRRARRDLKALADATGGQAYFPDTLDQVTPVCEQVAKEIRNQYTLGYYPTNPAKDGTFREVKVDVIPPSGYDHLMVRTRVGYYAPKASAAD
jgi:Ca-activated chloride channel family protein